MRNSTQEERTSPAGQPIGDDDLEALFDHLTEASASGHGCGNTLRRTRAFLESRGIENVEEACRWLDHRGGHCDCEVLLNTLLKM